MKILGWLQCKLRNNNSTLRKDSSEGNNCCLSLNSSWKNKQDYSWPKNGTTISSKGRNGHFERYLSECHMEEPSEESFPGFLTIGTLNVESNTSTEPATPTFGLGEASEVLEMAETKYDDLKHINDELEKFLKAESENIEFNKSGRESVASTITLSGKEKDDGEVRTAFPLQSYLFSSSYDLSGSEDEVEKEKGTLRELFRRRREVDKNSCINLDTIEEDQGVNKYKAPHIHPMRMILQTFQPSNKKEQVLRNGGATQSFQTGKGFRKIKKLFQKKVHPEERAAAKESNKLGKHNKDKTKLGYKKPQIEQWINTDEDYLVLELGQK